MCMVGGYHGHIRPCMNAGIADGNRGIIFTDMLTLLAPHTVLSTERYLAGGLAELTDAMANSIRGREGCEVVVGQRVASLVHSPDNPPRTMAGSSTAAEGGAPVTGVRLESGRQLECDAVVLAVNPDALPALTALASTLRLHQISFVTVRECAQPAPPTHLATVPPLGNGLQSCIFIL